MVKRLLIFIMLIFLSGCSTKIEYVPQIVIKEVKVPVKHKIPNYDCEFDAPTLPGVVDKLLKCVKDLKTILDTLKGEENE